MKYLILSLSILITFLSYSQNNQHSLGYYLPENTVYNSNIPTPKDILGFEVGQWHVTHDKLVQYMQAIAKSSDRVNIETIGYTYEDRPLLQLTITSPENLKNIESIRQNHIAALERENSSKYDGPVIVYQGYSVHGNEPSGSNASILLAYHLAAAQGDDIENLLENTIILLDPCLNPDGFQRFAYWANINKNQNLNPDPNDKEYHEVWPGGRTNHYWFDLNRDWLPVQLPESKARVTQFHKWKPNISTDFHEMGTNATYFFQPGIPSRTHPLTPSMNQKLTQEIAKYHAKALDKLGSLYYSEESFDDYYYGKGSTFPDINGGIGILFEQASSRGHIQESDNGLITFPFTIRNQLTTSLSTLKAATSLKKGLIDYQISFYKNARNEAAKEANKAIIFGDEKDAAKTFHLAEILNRHQIKLQHLKEDITLDGKTYKEDYAYIIPKNQNNIRLINAIFEKRTQFQDSLFYDVSAWTLPLAFNLDYSENISTSKGGDLVKSLEINKGNVSGKSDYAYLVEWHEYYTPKFLNALQQKGIRVKASLKQFKAAYTDYDYGTLLIPVQNQVLDSAELYLLLKELAEDSNLKVNAVATGLNEGIDLGSRNFITLKKQSIAIIVGNGVRSYDAGEIWHLLDTRYNVKVTKLDVSYLNSVDLNRYTTIIIPSSSSFDNTTTQKFKDWVKQGGHLIGFRNTMNWLKNNNFLNFEMKKTSLEAQNISYENRRNFRGAQVIGGAIFNTKLDRSHPISFGIKNDNLPVFRNTTLFIEPNKNSYHNPILYTDNPLLSGYISKRNLDSLKGTTPFIYKSFGKGKVSAFTDNTNFRAFWYGTNKLMANAIFFGELY